MGVPLDRTSPLLPDDESVEDHVFPLAGTVRMPEDSTTIKAHRVRVITVRREGLTDWFLTQVITRGGRVIIHDVQSASRLVVFRAETVVAAQANETGVVVVRDIAVRFEPDVLAAFQDELHGLPAPGQSAVTGATSPFSTVTNPSDAT